MKILATICLTGICLSPAAHAAETNLPPLRPAPVHIRDANGVTYDIEKSTLWVLQSFQFLQRTNNLVIARVVRYVPEYATRYYRDSAAGEDVRHGLFGPGLPSGGSYQVKIGERRELGGQIAITNLTRPFERNEEFKLATMAVGRVGYRRETIALHDAGTLHYFTENDPLAKALRDAEALKAATRPPVPPKLDYRKIHAR